MDTYTPMTVTYDDGETAYPALVLDGERWNGFLLPFFTFATVVKMGQDMLEIHRYAAPRFSFRGLALIVEQDGEETYALDSVVLPNGEIRYGVGAGSWTWSEHAPEYAHTGFEADAL